MATSEFNSKVCIALHARKKLCWLPVHVYNQIDCFKEDSIPCIWMLNFLWFGWFLKESERKKKNIELKTQGGGEGKKGGTGLI